jgi:hypothetical protein
LTDISRDNRDSVHFDDTDYSVVVKNRGPPSKPVAVGDLSSPKIEPDRSIADLLSHRVGRYQSRENGAEAVAG